MWECQRLFELWPAFLEKTSNLDESSKSTEEVDSCGKWNTLYVWVHSQKPHISFPLPLMHLPIFGTCLHLSTVVASIRNAATTFIKTSNLIWHSYQAACSGNGNIESNIMGKLSSVLQWMDGLLPKDHEWTSESWLHSPAMWSGVRGDTFHSFKQREKAQMSRAPMMPCPYCFFTLDNTRGGLQGANTFAY